MCVVIFLFLPRERRILFSSIYTVCGCFSLHALSHLCCSRLISSRVSFSLHLKPRNATNVAATSRHQTLSLRYFISPIWKRLLYIIRHFWIFDGDLILLNAFKFIENDNWIGKTRQRARRRTPEDFLIRFNGDEMVMRRRVSALMVEKSRMADCYNWIVAVCRVYSSFWQLSAFDD